ncbi:MAG: lipase family alpha/beta hydrolase [Phycisphaerae bacterium]
MATANPVIVVHGIQGSWLKDEYPVDYQHSVLWTGILRKRFKALHLHPADPTVDAEATRLVTPHQAIPLIYESLVSEIREELEEIHPYVYMFTYDWRKDNRIAAAELGRFVERALYIAGVHQHAKRPKARRPQRVTLVGHSMGGLVIKWYATKVLSKAQAARRIDKIITMATPFRGSLKAVEALLPGARNLFGAENKKSMRHAARTMPGIYQLLPTWPEAVVSKRDTAPLSVFDPATWQKNLVATLRKRFGGDGFFRKMLADAKAFTVTVGRPWPEPIRRKVYATYGIDTRTWWQVPVDTAADNFFRFDEMRYGGGKAGVQEGDGTVHVTSSYRDELPKTHLRPDVAEFKDKLAGHHANMPNHAGVQDWVLGILGVNAYARAWFESSV